MTEKKKWVCVFKSSSRFEADAVQGNLLSADIPCVIVNRQDSSYLAFGYVEVHVPENLHSAAQIVIHNQFDQN